MRTRIINMLKSHPRILNFFWIFMKHALQFIGLFVPINKRRIVFACFGGRKYDDSPRAIYEEMIKREEFSDWDFVWAFVRPEQFEIPRGRKVKIDTPTFFKMLLSSRVWVSNSGMDRGIDIQKRGIIKVETWHGAPIKKIGIDQNENVLGNSKTRKKVDNTTIRCAQSSYDLEIFSKIFNASKDCFLLSDLPRNDGINDYSDNELKSIKQKLGIPLNKKIILYMPTYREYIIDIANSNYLEPPITISKWEKFLSKEYVILLRGHYALGSDIDIFSKNFVFDVSHYEPLKDLYGISDVLISDYSSAFIDFSISGKPMLCFAYDLDEYEKERGLYINLYNTLPCPICKNEDELITEIINLNYVESSAKSIEFKMKFAPYSGSSSKTVVDTILSKL